MAHLMLTERVRLGFISWYILRLSPARHIIIHNRKFILLAPSGFGLLLRFILFLLFRSVSWLNGWLLGWTTSIRNVVDQVIHLIYLTHEVCNAWIHLSTLIRILFDDILRLSVLHLSSLNQISDLLRNLPNINNTLIRSRNQSLAIIWQDHRRRNFTRAESRQLFSRLNIIDGDILRGAASDDDACSWVDHCA